VKLQVKEPILIWGAGAIGGTLGAYWARAGIPVQLVDIVEEHVEACRTTGLAIEGPVEQFRVVVAAVTPEEVKGVFRRTVLAVKAHATETAIQRLAPHVANNGLVLSAQNGLNEIAIAKVVGEARTIGCFVNFGADWRAPGRILFANRGAVVIGEVDGSIRRRTRRLHELLKIFASNAVLTDNIWGYLWGKLAYGAMLFATALNNESISDNFADPYRFVVFNRLGREVMAVARARGIEPVGFDGFDPLAFAADAPEATTRTCIAELAKFNRGGAKSHSGVWRDLAVRKRKTEVDLQIGIISERAREVGVDTPAICRLVQLVHDIEEGRRPLALETFKVLIDTCTLLSTIALHS
jgi:2-dehydropantoate 2-reductase